MLQNRIKKGVLSLMYTKALKFPLIRNQEYSSGSIINHMVVDVENMSKIFGQLSQIIQMPVIMIIGLYVLFKTVGMAFIGGVLALVALGLVIMWFTKILYQYQAGEMKAKDIRMKRTNEILSGIKYIKMCGTEQKFLENVFSFGDVASNNNSCRFFKIERMNYFG